MTRKMMIVLGCLLVALLITAAFVSAGGQKGKVKLPAGHPDISGAHAGCPMMDGKVHGKAAMDGKSGGCGSCGNHSASGGCPMMKESARVARKDLVRDKVCKMDIPKSHAVKASYQGKAHYFCSPSCKVKFTRDPARYLKSPARPLKKA